MHGERLASFISAACLLVLWVVAVVILDWPVETVMIVGIPAFAGAMALAFNAGRPASSAGKGKLRNWWGHLSRRSRADLIAGTVAVLVFCGTAVALLLQPIPAEPSGPQPGDVKTTTTSETSTDAAGKSTETEKTVTESEEKAETRDDSLLGRSLDNDAAIYLFRLAIALLAGFIAGLVVQRVGLGKYGVTLPFGLGGVEEITEEQTAALDAKIARDPKLREAVEEAPEPPVAAPRSVANERLEVASAGAETERALRAKAKVLPDVDPEAPLPRLIEEVSAASGLSQSGRQAIEDVITLSNEAAQGAPLGPGVGRWFAEEGSRLAAAIESIPPAR